MGVASLENVNDLAGFFSKLNFYKGVHRWTLMETDYQKRLDLSAMLGSANKYHKINALQHFNYTICMPSALLLSHQIV
ncbi:mCG147560 [Mus musculus]|nr:mCG147560 [Mus musculus]